ncbi:hypothetical protein I552_1636 [Mycobacterium xenopi 3993]|nr:hypothetical protein I552_1636 [Mycobacterium xenopi 3993]
MKDIRRAEMVARLGWHVITVIKEDPASDVVWRARNALAAAAARRRETEARVARPPETTAVASVSRQSDLQRVAGHRARHAPRTAAAVPSSEAAMVSTSMPASCKRALVRALRS